MILFINHVTLFGCHPGGDEGTSQMHEARPRKDTTARVLVLRLFSLRRALARRARQMAQFSRICRNPSRR